MQLYNKDFLDFLASIPDYSSTIDEVVMSLSKSLSRFAPQIKIGKIDFRIDSQPSMFEPKGNNNYYMLFCS